MKVYKTYIDVINNMLPNKKDWLILGDILIKHYRDRLKSNKTSGESLTKKTTERKTKRGAKSPYAKLVEGGGLVDQIKKVFLESQLEVGYIDESEIHRKFKSKDKSIEVAKLANVHHNNKKKPRQFLVLNTIEERIVDDWLTNIMRRGSA
jgi:hypothetical protein